MSEETLRDPYTYLGSRVLINKADIREQDKLSSYERHVSSIAGFEAKSQSFALSSDGYCNLHKQLLGRVYDWAGEYRTINISKGISSFSDANTIKEKMDKQFSRLDLKTLQQVSEVKMFEKLGNHIAELNVIHPFREGNGRTMRLHASHIARDAGYPIDISKINPEKWMNASRFAFLTGNSADLAQVLAEARVSLAQDFQPSPLKSDGHDFKRLEAMLYKVGKDSPAATRQIIENERNAFKKANRPT